MSQLLREHTRLVLLNARDGELGVTGATNLGAALRGTSTLEVLILETNGIYWWGTQSLLQGGGQGLRQLNLADNHLGRGGATHVGKALRELTRLTGLDLSCNDIDDRGVAGLTEGGSAAQPLAAEPGGK